MDEAERNYRVQIHQLEAAVRVQDEYIRQQTAKLRELEAYCRKNATTQYTPDDGARLVYAVMAKRVEAILGLVVSEEEPL